MSFNLFNPDLTPVLMPPKGIIPNFENPESIAYISRNVIYAFLPIMLVFLGLRLCSRGIVRHNLGLDDGKITRTIRERYGISG